ncbi:DUF1289 domain-containing protein [Gammaproteobacteria bacterium]|jgi:predicted Fe-S protein YdhL (DUF1289 family)|nr:DUF1289 domain-containing protein [Gammaproteobacteria bacterium]MDA9112604.1 DUF1289 domain-containing protein [Gammaproteobacteria bacterium]MDB4252970.1 DUF1289 domain-containing protein [Gammaproteobacteria bacterium]|tara:strand:+ start:258 stop:695 length:438 start_codon:yes stop_codon:yes gene_type:complete
MSMSRSTTPCLGICSTTYGDNVCKGCKRFVHEVIDWNKFNSNEKEVVNNRLEKFKQIVLKERFCVDDQDLLASKLKENGIRFNDSLDPITWIFDLLRASGSQELDLDEFGITASNNELLSITRDAINKEFLELSEAHHDRYFKAL